MYPVEVKSTINRLIDKASFDSAFFFKWDLTISSFIKPNDNYWKYFIIFNFVPPRNATCLVQANSLMVLDLLAFNYGIVWFALKPGQRCDKEELNDTRDYFNFINYCSYSLFFIKAYL